VAITDEIIIISQLMGERAWATLPQSLCLWLRLWANLGVFTDPTLEEMRYCYRENMTKFKETPKSEKPNIFSGYATYR